MNEIESSDTTDSMRWGITGHAAIDHFGTLMMPERSLNPS